MALTYEEAIEFIDVNKVWEPEAIRWIEVDRGGWPVTFEFRATLLRHRISIEGAWVVLRYKRNVNDSLPDLINFVLLYQNERILALDEDGERTHNNKVGQGMPYYGKRIEHPHIHIPVQDSMGGYAEPLERKPINDLWRDFLDHANILVLVQTVT